MSEENEIKWPLRESYFNRRGVLYQVIKETLPYARDNDVDEFVEGLENTTKGSVTKEKVREYLEYLEEQRGDYFMHSQCREIAKRLEL